MNRISSAVGTRRRGTKWAAVASLSAIAVSLAVPSSVQATNHSASVKPLVGASQTVAHWGSLSDVPGVINNQTLSPAQMKLPGPVAEVATSNSTYYALLVNGTVYAWGMGDHGQLGNGTTKNSFTKPLRVRFPAGVRIASLPNNVMPYDTGQAVDTTGHVWGWGYNRGGELCLGNRHQHRVPVQLPFTRVTAVAGAFDHAVYESAGQVWACGLGALGELGNGTTGTSFVPVKVKGLGPSAHVVALVSAFGNAGALLADGRYLNWGVNGLGQLGINSTAKRSDVPVAVHLPAKVTQVTQGGSAPGNGQTLVLLFNGAMYAWGADKAGQLGDGKTTAERAPVRITPPSGVTYHLLASNGSTSYGVTPAGEVYAWGAGSQGQIGNGTNAGSLTPVNVASGATGISGTAFDVLISTGPHPPSRAVGTLTQLQGSSGCLVGSAKTGCQLVRALQGPGPLLGSHAVALSPHGRNLYVASSRSQAVAVFRRNQSTGKLTQAPGPAGCVAARGADGCRPAVGLGGPNSVTVSPDGKNVYATSAQGDSIAIFRRDPTTGALTQLTGIAGCIAKTATPRCASARALNGPDVIAVSPNGKNVYVGAFFGDAALAFRRNGSTGALTQLQGTSGCISSVSGAGCAHGIAMKNPEGLAVSADGKNVYVAAAVSDAVDVLTRNAATGALTQATDGTGCLTSTPQVGCRSARALRGSDAVAISPDDRTVYIAGGISAGIAILTRNLGTGKLTQQAGSAGCVLNFPVAGCALGRRLIDPEGLSVSPDGASVYATTYLSNALDAFNRTPGTGALTQRTGRRGCFLTVATPNCTRVRGGVLGVSSSVVSPDGENLYAVAARSNSITVFHRRPTN